MGMVVAPDAENIATGARNGCKKLDGGQRCCRAKAHFGQAGRIVISAYPSNCALLGQCVIQLQRLHRLAVFADDTYRTLTPILISCTSHAAFLRSISVPLLYHSCKISKE